MSKLTPKRVTVLRELVELERYPWAVEHTGGWIPFHIRFFRGQGRNGEAGSWAYDAGLSVDACAAHLKRLAADGLILHVGGRGMGAMYRINAAGAEALAEWDRSHLAD